MEGQALLGLQREFKVESEFKTNLSYIVSLSILHKYSLKIKIQKRLGEVLVSIPSKNKKVNKNYPKR